MHLNTLQKSKKAGKIIIGLLIIVYFILTINGIKRGNDFDIFLDAGRKLSLGENIYKPPFAHDLQYFYSVFFALILIPFSGSIWISEIFWALLSLLFLTRSIQILSSYYNSNGLSARQKYLWILLSFILSLQFLLYNINTLQITFFLLWSILESIRFSEQKKWLKAGILLGIAINIKLMPVLMLSYLFYRGYFKTCIVSLIVFVLLLFVPAIFIGNSLSQYLLTEWWYTINPFSQQHVLETDALPQSLSAFIPIILTDSKGELPYKRNFVSLDFNTAMIILNLVRLLIFSLSLFFLRTLPFKSENNRLKSMWEISYFMFMIPLLFPHQHKYSFLLTIPLVIYILYFFISTYSYKKEIKGYNVLLGIFCFFMIVYSPLYGGSVIGSSLFRATQYFKAITIATIMLIPVAMFCNPGKIKISS